MTLPVQHKDDHLGAAPPVIILKAINTGLNADHLRLHNTHAYTRSLPCHLLGNGPVI